MKKEKKQKLLNKYLNKKDKQKRRDELIAELKKYESKNEISIIVDKKNKNKLKKDKYKNIKIKINDENKESNIDNTKSNNELQEQIDFKIEDVFKNKLEDQIEDNVNNETQYIEIIGTQKNKYFENEQCFEGNLLHLHNNFSDTKKPYLYNEGIDDVFLNLEKPRIKRTKKVDLERQKLPIYYDEESIITKIKQFDVSVIQGTTGCGKSTQISQFIYENGLCLDRKIIITQPRRLAAISISKRINYELNSDISAYQIRHENNITDKTRIKVVTEGILLNEIKNDFLLLDYSIIILDEVHEKTANMEILLSLLKQIQKERQKRQNYLKIIIMSANLNINDYFMLFDNKIGKIDIESNNYKVETFYEEKTPVDSIKAAYEKIICILDNKKYSNIIDIDFIGILVFVPGKDEIYRLINMLKAMNLEIIILPLHSSLSFDRQNMIYKEYEKPKIIVSTNISETSLTIPGINIVIDTGLAKYKQFTGNNLYTYTINYISKSSANQRTGRAGRTSNGFCFRLYSCRLYESLREMEQPEILNVCLDTHILLLKSIGVDSIKSLRLLSEIPDKQIRDGYKILERLGAIDKKGKITDLGLNMSLLPLNARYSRMVLTKSKNTLYLLLIASLLTIDFEVTNHIYTYKYYENSLSDILVKLQIVIDFFHSDNKQEFAKEIKVNRNIIEEIIKLYFQLCSILKCSHDFVEQYDQDIEVELHKIITMSFSDNLAISFEDNYLFNNKQIYVSKNSIAVESKYIVFDYLIEGKSKIYAKNITNADILFDK